MVPAGPKIGRKTGFGSGSAGRPGSMPSGASRARPRGPAPVRSMFFGRGKALFCIGGQKVEPPQEIRPYDRGRRRSRRKLQVVKKGRTKLAERPTSAGRPRGPAVRSVAGTAQGSSSGSGDGFTTGHSTVLHRWPKSGAPQRNPALYRGVGVREPEKIFWQNGVAA